MAAKMRAVGYAASLPVTDERSLFEFETAVPQPGPHDLLVRVHAVSVNPVDVKSRMRRQGTEAQPLILGWDAAGIVEAVGASCSLFKPGDHVYYAGNINRPGTDAQLHVVDECIVGRKPKSLSFAQAAALPLTTLTAWELMKDGIPTTVISDNMAGAMMSKGKIGAIVVGAERAGRRAIDPLGRAAAADQPALGARRDDGEVGLPAADRTVAVRPVCQVVTLHERFSAAGDERPEREEEHLVEAGRCIVWHTILRI